MNTGIGSSRSGHVDFVIEEFLKRGLQFALDGSQLRLNLPSVKVRAVICERQLEVPHPMGYSMCLGGRAMPGVTATIITFNEEARIAEAIVSLACCDEIVVVDSGSTDRTREIAKGLGARVTERAWHGYSDQKNFAADQASYDWILNLDADERLSIELADQIAQWKKSDPSNRAWSMPRRVFYLGRWIKHSGWYPDRKVRLYDRRRCRFEGAFVHESVKVEGPVGRFHGDLLHFPYRDWNDHSKKLDRYTQLAADAARSSGTKGSKFKLIMAPPIAFVKSFLLRGGFLDGWRGFAIAYMGARYVFQREFRILR